MNATSCPLMPEWHIAHWFNTDGPLRVADLRGQVVLIHAFQMLCPGCVIHAIPQARKVHELYGDQGVAVIGLHTVFEHHDAMQRQQADQPADGLRGERDDRPGQRAGFALAALLPLPAARERNERCRAQPARPGGARRRGG